MRFPNLEQRAAVDRISIYWDLALEKSWNQHIEKEAYLGFSVFEDCVFIGRLGHWVWVLTGRLELMTGLRIPSRPALSRSKSS